MQLMTVLREDLSLPPYSLASSMYAKAHEARRRREGGRESDTEIGIEDTVTVTDIQGIFFFLFFFSKKKIRRKKKRERKNFPSLRSTWHLSTHAHTIR